MRCWPRCASSPARVEIDLTPQEVPWTVAARPGRRARAPTIRTRCATYFAAATQAALVLAELRAPYRGRSTPVNAWWGSFDLAVSLFSGAARRSALGRLHHAQLDGLAGSRRRLVARRRALRQGGVLRLRAPGAGGLLRGRRSSPAAARWDAELGVFILDWDDVRASARPAARRARVRPLGFHHACRVCEWDPVLPASAEGKPPPVA